MSQSFQQEMFFKYSFAFILIFIIVVQSKYFTTNLALSKFAKNRFDYISKFAMDLGTGTFKIRFAFSKEVSLKDENNKSPFKIR